MIFNEYLQLMCSRYTKTVRIFVLCNILVILWHSHAPYFLFLKGIYQLYYKEASSNDRGSLYQLRNLVNRRDVCGGPKDVISKFRYMYELKHSSN